MGSRSRILGRLLVDLPSATTSTDTHSLLHGLSRIRTAFIESFPQPVHRHHWYVVHVNLSTDQITGRSLSFFRCNHLLVQRKHIPSCPPDVRGGAITSATHHPRNGRTVHDPGEYLRIVAGGEGTASVVSHRYDTLDGGSRGGSWG